jgi:DNA-binding NarL/FixJ family response regulator
MCDGLKSILERQDGFIVVEAVGDGRLAVQAVRNQQIDVAILDINMPNLNGIEACRQIKSVSSQTQVLALSVHSDNEFISKMIEAGASGYVPKNCSGQELIKAIQQIAKGKRYLSPEVADSVFIYLQTNTKHKKNRLSIREREVLQMISEGKTSKEIAACLNISESTIETHRRKIMDKLNIRNIAELTKFAVREGLTTLE